MDASGDRRFVQQTPERDVGNANVSVRSQRLSRSLYRRLAQIAGPLGLDTARRRADGFALAVEAAGLPTPVLVEAAFDEAGAFAAMETLLAARETPTGVFISNPNQAIGTLACVRRGGAPADVEVETPPVLVVRSSTGPPRVHS